MEQEPMNVILSEQGTALLRDALNRHPEMSAAEIVEAALAARLVSEPMPSPRLRTSEEIRAWLDELAFFSGNIPAMPGETFSREMIYQDRD